MTLAVRVLEEYLPGALLAVITIVIAADVALRYSFNSPQQWASEVAILCTVWIVYLASARVMRRAVHVSRDFFSSRLSSRAQAASDLAIEVFNIAVIGYVFVAAVDYMDKARFVELPGTGLAAALVPLAVPFLMSLVIVHSMVRRVAAGRAVPRRARAGQRAERRHDRRHVGIRAGRRGGRLQGHRPGDAQARLLGRVRLRVDGRFEQD